MFHFLIQSKCKLCSVDLPVNTILLNLTTFQNEIIQFAEYSKAGYLCYMKRIIYASCFLLILCFSACRTKNKTVGKAVDMTVSIPVVGIYETTKARKTIVKTAHKWIGVQYKYGGNSKEQGTDCSGMVLQVYFEACDLKLPRNSAKQAEFCNKIKENEVLPGDLVFFATGHDPSIISHVGIMLDNDNFIHSATSKGVCISRLSTPYYQRTFRMFGRVPGLK